MFVRLRTSATNLALVDKAVAAWTAAQVPVVITFMAYYDAEPQVPDDVLQAVGGPCYEWRVRHINSYWCPTPAFIRWVCTATGATASCPTAAAWKAPTAGSAATAKRTTCKPSNA